MKVRFWCAVLGALFLLGLIIAACMIPLSAALEHDLENRLLAPAQLGHLLGTDALGRDNLLRLLAGSRLSLLRALIVTASAFMIGVPLGLLFRRAPQWLQWLPKALAYLSFIDPQNQLSSRWPSRALLGLLMVGGIAPILLVWLIIAAVSALYGEVFLSQIAYGATLTPAIIFVMLQAPGTPEHVISPRTPCLDWTLGALIFSIALITQMWIDFFGSGVMPPMPSWGGILADLREYRASPNYPLAAVCIIAALTVASILVIADEITARLRARQPLQQSL